MTDQSISVFSFGRTQSARCRNKMLRPFAGTTITDRVLDKLKRLPYDSFFAAHEPAFREKCEAHGVRFVARSLRSATIDEPIVDILDFLRAIESRYLVIVSACLPLLPLEEIKDFIERSLADGRPAMSARLHRTYFLRARDLAPLSFDGAANTINTKTVEPVYELVHGLYFFEKSFFFEHGRYWNWSQLRLHELKQPHLLIDIDTESDFVAAESLCRAYAHAST
jgi:molybdopterin-guanine dinucleotide biosynthesis protein A